MRDIEELIQEGENLKGNFKKMSLDLGYKYEYEEIEDKERYFKWLNDSIFVLKSNSKDHILFSQWREDEIDRITLTNHVELLEVLNNLG